MLKSLTIAFAAFCALSTAANASCFGSGTFRTCSDSNGNTYNIQRYGNSTNMQGYNAQTGSSWSQNSQTYGNSTYTQGRAADGGSWNMNQQRIGNTTFYSGTDSDGNSFSGSCGAYGCN
ncbi:hypothetical protein [Rhizobium sp. BK661]|uniref:hypothetical protein n=1 Tax=Rhizobium sp. BK661 TaxID=2586991 RepID=UPI002169D160|nr:hypothetical protein [Rhizobium sp. BK661]MCS3740222.1 hypothetical protein [Rhizobium sp. BK661]